MTIQVGGLSIRAASRREWQSPGAQHWDARACLPSRQYRCPKLRTLRLQCDVNPPSLFWAPAVQLIGFTGEKLASPRVSHPAATAPREPDGSAFGERQSIHSLAVR